MQKGDDTSNGRTIWHDPSEWPVKLHCQSFWDFTIVRVLSVRMNLGHRECRNHKHLDMPQRTCRAELRPRVDSVVFWSTRDFVFNYSTLYTIITRNVNWDDVTRQKAYSNTFSGDSQVASRVANPAHNKTNPEARKHFDTIRGDDINKRQMDLQLVQRTSMLSKSELASGCDVALAQRLRRTKRRLLLAAVGQDASESTCSVSSRNNLHQRLSFESFTSHDSMSGSSAL